jgi:hypothetical protein
MVASLATTVTWTTAARITTARQTAVCGRSSAALARRSISLPAVARDFLKCRTASLSRPQVTVGLGYDIIMRASLVRLLVWGVTGAMQWWLVDCVRLQFLITSAAVRVMVWSRTPTIATALSSVSLVRLLLFSHPVNIAWSKLLSWSCHALLNVVDQCSLQALRSSCRARLQTSPMFSEVDMDCVANTASCPPRISIIMIISCYLFIAIFIWW